MLAAPNNYHFRYRLTADLNCYLIAQQDALKQSARCAKSWLAVSVENAFFSFSPMVTMALAPIPNTIDTSSYPVTQFQIGIFQEILIYNQPPLLSVIEVDSIPTPGRHPNITDVLLNMCDARFAPCT